jgi:hypothetical protein
LDQFLEDIPDIGVSENEMLRLGAKSTLRTKSLGLYEQSGNYRRSQNSWNLLKNYSDKADGHSAQVHQRVSEFHRFEVSDEALLEYLQFLDDDTEFFSTLTTPTMMME